jgi:predicted secreted protein
MRLYKIVSLGLAATFILVGVVFLFFPDGVVSFFNALSRSLGMEESAPGGFHFYLVLTGGYMYLVALLAWLMFRFPDNSDFPFLLANGKIATSIISLGFFLLHQPLLIYLVNFVVDGLIGAVVLAFYLTRKVRRR